MSCNDKNHSVYASNCVCDVVKFINELQDVAQDSCPTGCENPILGANCGSTSPIANTRPFILFDKKGQIFLPASCFNIKNNTSHFLLDISVPLPFLRAESVDDCCAVLGVLAPDTSTLSEKAKEELAELINRFITDEVDFQAIARVLVCAYQNGVTFENNEHLVTEFFGLQATGFCITLDLDCFCAIQSLRDTFVMGV
ncbi:CotY/CotZ family spore coat protein [Microbacteriaceae bacterium 4G12]